MAGPILAQKMPRVKKPFSGLKAQMGGDQVNLFPLDVNSAPNRAARFLQRFARKKRQLARADDA